MAKREFLVRLRPRPKKPRKGLPTTPARYLFRGVRFEESKGWYKIEDAEFAEELLGLTHNDREDGVPIFDVCTPEEALAIQRREARARARARPRDVEEAEVQAVAPVSLARRRRPAADAGSAVTMADVRPDALSDEDDEELRGRVRENAQSPMIDGADGEEDEGFEEDDEEVIALGRLPDGYEQELDDGDDLLEEGREPNPPKLYQTAEAKAPSQKKSSSSKPQTRKKSSTKKGSAKKS